MRTADEQMATSQYRPLRSRHPVIAVRLPDLAARRLRPFAAACLLFFVSLQFLSGVWRMNNWVLAI